MAQSDHMNSMDVAAIGRPRRPEVMVSYSSQERPQVLQLVQRLRAAGVAVWIDHGGIDGAQKWGEEIVTAIEECKTVLVMVSRTSMASDNIAKEVQLASDNRKRLLPLYLEDAEIPRSMRYPFSGIQHIKLYEGDPEERFLSVLRALMRLGVHVSPYYLAVISAERGDRDQAFEWLNKSVEARSGALARLQTESRLASLRSDPRFAELSKRVTSVELDPEESSTQVPIMLPGPPGPPVPRGPEPLYKRIFWPEIFDDRSVRHATSLGIWTTAFLVAASFLLPFFLAWVVGAIPMGALGWNNPLLFIVLFGPIAFGLQKMGRPAAIIGLVLCSLGSIGNLMFVISMQAAVNTYAQYQAQYGSQYQNPLVAQYYASWFGLVVGAVCVLGFANATRGTLAYHQMVQSRRATDKQVAITKDDFAAIRASVAAAVKKIRMAIPALKFEKPSPPALAPVSATMMSSKISAAMPQPVPSESMPASPVTPAAVVQSPEDSADGLCTFPELIGSRGTPISWMRSLAFTSTNVVAGVTYIIWLTATSKYQVDRIYWQWAIGKSIVFSIVAVAAFRLVKRSWKAAAVAAVISAALALPLYSSLPGFVWGDLIYREQFQQFFLVPSLNFFILLFGLVLAVPRVRPTPLALWLGAMGAEVLTPLLANILKAFGGGQAPDQMLASTSVIFAVIRSLIFAFVFWGVLKVTQQQNFRQRAQLERENR